MFQREMLITFTKPWTAPSFRLGRVEMTRSGPHFVDLYCVRHSAKGRKRQSVTSTVARSKRSRQSARRECEPWLLASNLPQIEWTPAKIVAIYKRRMQIEEGFRDVKREHLGLGLNLHRSHCPKRIEVLLIAALASYLIFLAGLQARDNHLEQRYQSNILKEKRVLPLWRFGLEYGRSFTGFGDRKHLKTLEHALRDEVHHQTQSLE